MKTCRNCGLTHPDNVYICPVCDRTLPFNGPSPLAIKKAGITILVPILVWIVMSRLLGL